MPLFYTSLCVFNLSVMKRQLLVPRGNNQIVKQFFVFQGKETCLQEGRTIGRPVSGANFDAARSLVLDPA